MIRTDMSPMSIIVAVDEDGGFGKDGKIPWNIPEDMKHFQKITKGGVCIMGRKTYEDMVEMYNVRMKKKDPDGDIPPIKKILPNRESFVVTSNIEYDAQGATPVLSIRQAIESLQEDDKREVFILGGKRMFIEALAWATTIHMTIVKGDPRKCDLFFPLDALNTFKLSKGEETDDLYFVTYTK